MKNLHHKATATEEKATGRLSPTFPVTNNSVKRPQGEETILTSKSEWSYYKALQATSENGTALTTDIKREAMIADDLKSSRLKAKNKQK